MTSRMAYDVTDLIPDSLSAIYFARQDHRIDDSDLVAGGAGAGDCVGADGLPDEGVSLLAIYALFG